MANEATELLEKLAKDGFTKVQINVLIKALDMKKAALDADVKKVWGSKLEPNDYKDTYKFLGKQAKTNINHVIHMMNLVRDGFDRLDWFEKRIKEEKSYDKDELTNIEADIRKTFREFNSEQGMKRYFSSILYFDKLMDGFDITAEDPNETFKTYVLNDEDLTGQNKYIGELEAGNKLPDVSGPDKMKAWIRSSLPKDKQPELDKAEEALKKPKEEPKVEEEPVQEQPVEQQAKPAPEEPWRIARDKIVARLNEAKGKANEAKGKADEAKGKADEPGTSPQDAEKLKRTETQWMRIHRVYDNAAQVLELIRDAIDENNNALLTLKRDYAFQISCLALCENLDQPVYKVLPSGAILTDENNERPKENETVRDYFFGRTFNKSAIGTALIGLQKRWKAEWAKKWGRLDYNGLIEMVNNGLFAAEKPIVQQKEEVKPQVAKPQVAKPKSANEKAIEKLEALKKNAEEGKNVYGKNVNDRIMDRFYTIYDNAASAFGYCIEAVNGEKNALRKLQGKDNYLAYIYLSENLGKPVYKVLPESAIVANRSGNKPDKNMTVEDYLRQDFDGNILRTVSAGINTMLADMRTNLTVDTLTNAIANGSISTLVKPIVQQPQPEVNDNVIRSEEERQPVVVPEMEQVKQPKEEPKKEEVAPQPEPEPIVQKPQPEVNANVINEPQPMKPAEAPKPLTLSEILEKSKTSEGAQYLEKINKAKQNCEAALEELKNFKNPKDGPELTGKDGFSETAYKVVRSFQKELQGLPFKFYVSVGGKDRQTVVGCRNALHQFPTLLGTLYLYQHLNTPLTKDSNETGMQFLQKYYQDNKNTKSKGRWSGAVKLIMEKPYFTAFKESLSDDMTLLEMLADWVPAKQVEQPLQRSVLNIDNVISDPDEFNPDEIRKEEQKEDLIFDGGEQMVGGGDESQNTDNLFVGKKDDEISDVLNEMNAQPQPVAPQQQVQNVLQPQPQPVVPQPEGNDKELIEDDIPIPAFDPNNNINNVNNKPEQPVLNIDNVLNKPEQKETTELSWDDLKKNALAAIGKHKKDTPPHGDTFFLWSCLDVAEDCLTRSENGSEPLSEGEKSWFGQTFLHLNDKLRMDQVVSTHALYDFDKNQLKKGSVLKLTCHNFYEACGFPKDSLVYQEIMQLPWLKNMTTGDLVTLAMAEDPAAYIKNGLPAKENEEAKRNRELNTASDRLNAKANDLAQKLKNGSYLTEKENDLDPTTKQRLTWLYRESGNACNLLKNSLNVMGYATNREDRKLNVKERNAVALLFLLANENKPATLIDPNEKRGMTCRDLVKESTSKTLQKLGANQKIQTWLNGLTIEGLRDLANGEGLSYLQDAADKLQPKEQQILNDEQKPEIDENVINEQPVLNIINEPQKEPDNTTIAGKRRLLGSSEESRKFEADLEKADKICGNVISSISDLSYRVDVPDFMDNNSLEKLQKTVGDLFRTFKNIVNGNDKQIKLSISDLVNKNPSGKLQALYLYEHFNDKVPDKFLPKNKASGQEILWQDLLYTKGFPETAGMISNVNEFTDFKSTLNEVTLVNWLLKEPGPFKLAGKKTKEEDEKSIQHGNEAEELFGKPMAYAAELFKQETAEGKTLQFDDDLTQQSDNEPETVVQQPEEPVNNIINVNNDNNKSINENILNIDNVNNKPVFNIDNVNNKDNIINDNDEPQDLRSVVQGKITELNKVSGVFCFFAEQGYQSIKTILDPQRGNNEKKSAENTLKNSFPYVFAYQRWNQPATEIGKAKTYQQLVENDPNGAWLSEVSALDEVRKVIDDPSEENIRAALLPASVVKEKSSDNIININNVNDEISERNPVRESISSVDNEKPVVEADLIVQSRENSIIAPEPAQSADDQFNDLKKTAARMLRTQHEIRGWSSTQFTDLQEKLYEFVTYMQRRNKNESSYAGYEDRETKEKLAELGKYARAYLRIKQDANGRMKNDLKKVTKDRYALALHIEQLAKPVEAVMNAPDDDTVHSLKNADNYSAELEKLWVDMDKSQRALIGRGSKEFRDLYDAVKGFRNIETGRTQISFSNNVERKDALNRINKLAQKYIDMKEIEVEKEAKKGKKLSDTANTRLDIARRMRSFTSAAGQAIEKKEQRIQKSKNENEKLCDSVRKMTNNLYAALTLKKTNVNTLLNQTRQVLYQKVDAGLKGFTTWIASESNTNLERVILCHYVLEEQGKGGSGELEEKLNGMSHEDFSDLIQSMKKSDKMKNLRESLRKEPAKVKNLFSEKKTDYESIFTKKDLDSFLKPQQAQKEKSDSDLKPKNLII